MGPAVAPAAACQVAITLVLVQCIFAANGLFVKLAVSSGTDPVVFTFWRDVCASPILLALARTSRFGPFRWPAGQGDFVMLFILGLTGVVGSHMLAPVALRYVEPTTFALFQLLIPVVTPFMAFVVGLEDPKGGLSWLRIAGLLICIMGAGCDLLSKASLQGQRIGFALLTVQVCSSSIFQLLMRRMLMAGWPPTALTAWAYTIGTAQLMIVVTAERPSTFCLNWLSLGALAFAVLGTSVFNYAAMASANQRMGPSAVTAFFPLQVVLATLLQPAAGLPWPSVMDYAAVVVVCVGLAVFMLAEASSEYRRNAADVTPVKVGAAHSSHDECARLT